MQRIALALALVAGLLLAGFPAAAQTLRIDTAIAASGDGRSFPAGAETRTASLPDEWARSRPAERGPVWYRVGFSADAVGAGDDRDELLALYIARVCANLEVFLNGQQVASGGRMREPIVNNCNHPQLVTLPAALLVPGLNTLDIKVAGYPLAEVASRTRAGGLSALEIGPQSELAPRHSRATALNVWLPHALGATLVLTGGFMAVLGFFNRRESHLAYFGALAVGWAIVDARLWLRLPLPNAVVEFVLAAMLPLLTLAAVQFLLRYARYRNPAINVALLAQAALMPLTLLIAGPGRLYAATTVWSALLLAQVVAAGLFYLQAQSGRPARVRWSMGALLAAVAGAAAIEVTTVHAGSQPLVAHVAHLVPPLIFVILGLRMVQQHGRALQEAELGKAHLEQRVREATEEIERNFRQLSELKVEQVTERERKRIAADLHDDLGAKLLTIVHTSESERIASLAREALEEMRLSVRGLTGKPVRLNDALGDWRAETVNRLGQAGIEAEWTTDEDLPQMLSARGYVQTTRILREATSNIIKHSGASHCAISCHVADGWFQLVIQDNGEGIPMELDGRLDRGHGMASMKQRAKQLQGQCLVESGPGYGTVIRLTLPLDRAMEAVS